MRMACRRSCLSVFVLYVSVSIFCVLSDDSDPSVKIPDVKFSSGTSADSGDEFSADFFKKATENSEKRGFGTNVDKMMKLIVNSLYKNKEIFLRELISNAADALEKLRYLSLTNPKELETLEEMTIRIKIDEKSRTLSIRDTGIGMTKDDLVNNLGTIAKSGTSDFFEMAAGDSKSSLSDLIGQFGVGFYSVFLVADHVTVVSKNNNDDQYIWESDSRSFSLTKDPRDDTLRRGTEVILHLKDEAHNFLKHQSVKSIAKQFSQYITFPIYLWDSRTETVTEEIQPKETLTETVEDTTIEEETKDPKSEPKKVEKTVWDWLHINDQKPIWTRKVSDVSEEEYVDFFKAFTSSDKPPSAKVHFQAEGEVSFTALLFVPAKARFDLYTSKKPIVDNVKLYVRRVFITNNVDELLPRYLAFVYGIVDSENLPLNVSREMLQENKLLKIIKKKLVRKVIDMLAKLPQKEYEAIWNEYSVSIKLGVMEDQPNKARLLDLIRFKTSHSDSELYSFSDYIGRMKEKQEAIYFIGAPSLEEAKHSPFAERAIKKGFEVIYLTEPMDEFMMQAVDEVKSKKVQDLSKQGVSLDISDQSKEILEKQKKEFEPLLKWFKDTALTDKIKDAAITQRLHDSPCALVADSYGWSGNFQRLMTTQAFQSTEGAASQFQLSLKKTLEINPRHPLIKELKVRVSIDPNDEKAKENALLLFEVATMRSGYSLQDPIAFTKRVENIMRSNLGVRLDEDLEDEEVEYIDDSTAPATDFKTEGSDENDEAMSQNSETHEPESEEVESKDEL